MRSRTRPINDKQLHRCNIEYSFVIGWLMNETRCPLRQARKHSNTFPLHVRPGVQSLAQFEFI